MKSVPIRRKTQTLYLRDDVEPVLFEALRRSAAENDRTLTGQARHYLKRALEEDGYDVGREAA